MEQRVLGTRVQEWIWKTRHIYKGSNWVKGYCGSIDHPHRQLLIDKVVSYAPFESVLEIGCNTGPNLFLLAEMFPEAQLYGMDINSRAIKEGKRWFEEMGIKTVLLSTGKADRLNKFRDASIDVVFTDAVLIFIGPDRIEKAIEEMKRVARKAIILNEWHRESNSKGGERGLWLDGRWIYDYGLLLVHFFPPDNVRIKKLPTGLWGGGDWEEFGVTIEVSIEESPDRC